MISPFAHQAPRTVSEARTLLTTPPVAGKGGAVLIAGGTDLVPRLKHRLVEPELAVDLAAVRGIDRIEISPDGAALRLGAMATLEQLATAPEVQATFPILAKAAAGVATPQIRNIATLGGNLCQDVRCEYLNQTHFWRQSLPPCIKIGGTVCHQEPNMDRCVALNYSDLAAALLALDAQVRVADASGERTIPLAEFFTGPGETALGGRGLLLEVLVPPLPPRSGASFRRQSIRGSLEYALVVAAARVTLSPAGGSCQEARLAFAAVSPIPIRAREAETTLAGRPLDDQALEAAARAAARAIRPIPETFCSTPYRHDLVRTLTREVVLAAARQAEQPTQEGGASR